MKERRELTTVKHLQNLEKPLDAGVSSSFLGYSPEIETEEEIHLRDYWQPIRKRLWLVLGITGLITMMAAIYLARKADVYEAQARVQVDLENVNPALGGLKDSPIVLSSHYNDPSYFNTQLQILTGPGLLRRVVKTLDLEHNQTFLHPSGSRTRSTWQSLVGMMGFGPSQKAAQNANSSLENELSLTSSVAPASSREDLAEAKRLSPYVTILQAGLKVDPVKENRLAIRDTRLIDIRFEHSDPQMAAKVVNAIADVFVLSNLERKTETNASTGGYLERRIAELQAQIRTKEEELVNYAKNHQILSLDQSQNIVVDRLSGLNKQLLEAENDRKLAEATYKATLMPGAAAAEAESVDSKSISDAEGKLTELRQRRAQLLVENTEEWPEVKEINQQIAVIERRVSDIKTRAANVVTTNLDTKYHQALSREQALREALNQQQGETVTQNEAAINYRIIQQEIETYKSLLDGLLQRSKENDVVMAGTPNNIHIVDYAIAPDKPIGPKRFQGMLMALILSLGLGAGLALFLEYLDDTVRSTDDVEKTLRLPALAVIPSFGGSSRRRLLPGGGTARNGHSDKSELLVNADARSPLAEAYRQLRTSVLLSTAGRAPKTLLVTSSVPAEGKTTTAVNVAMSLVQTGASVLVVDADMRRPRVHKIFAIENRTGLSTLLSSDLTEEELLRSIVSDEASGLSLLSAGPIPPNPAELLGSDQMRKLFDFLEANFTHVIIDSPPIASFTDGVLIASMVDGVLLVVHGGKSSRNVVRRSRQLLLDVGAKIFGVVLNNVNLQSNDYYYYQRYYQQSYYNSSESEEEDVASKIEA